LSICGINLLLRLHPVTRRPIAVLSGLMNGEEAKELGVEFILPDVTHIEEVLNTLSTIEGQGRMSKERF